MFIEERHTNIIKLLQENGRVKVKELSQLFQVTEDCIRKDLRTLEKAGQLKRTYGGAILSKDYPLVRDVIERKDVNLEQKRKIAQKVMETLRDNETIFLDISTTNILVAKELGKSNRRMIVVSNMVDILKALSKNSNITAIGVGGTYVKTVNGFLGAETIEMIKKYSFDRVFVGTCGIDMTDQSITTLGAEDGLTKKAILESGRHRYLVMEREKFYFNECYKFGYVHEVDGIFTNELPDQATKEILDQIGVSLY